MRDVFGGRAMRAPVAGLVLGLLLSGGVAHGAASDGTIITNVATMTWCWASDAFGPKGVMLVMSYNVTATIRILTPTVRLWKTAAPTLQGAGGTVTFCLGFSNQSQYASAVNVVVTDQLPTGVFRFAAYLFDNEPMGGVITRDWSANGTTWNNVDCPANQGGAVWLRWTVDILGPKRSAYVCFLATVL